MAKGKRRLKKAINNIMQDMTVVAMASELNSKDVEKARELQIKILKANAEYISRLSHVEPGSTKAFYKKLHEDIDKDINTFLEDLAKLD